MAKPTHLRAVLARATAAMASAPATLAPDDSPDALARERRAQTLQALGIGLTAADERRLVLDEVQLDFGRAIVETKRWLTERDAPPWLFLLGPTGRGKTLAVAWALCGQGRRETFFAAPHLERLHEQRFGEQCERYRERRRERILIAVDDLGTELRPETMTAALAELVDLRRGEGHRTIVCTNLTAKALRERYRDARMWSRLDESARFIADAGADMRAKRGSK